MARKFCRKREVANPDDYYGVASLAVVVGIHNALKYLVEAEGINKYIATCIRQRIMAFYQEDRVVVTPARRQHDFYKLGYLTPITIEPYEDDQVCWYDSRIMQDMEEAYPDERTRKVAHLRVEGYNNVEIAVLLNLTIKQVRVTQKHLREIVKDLITEDDDDTIESGDCCTGADRVGEDHSRRY